MFLRAGFPAGLSQLLKIFEHLRKFRREFSINFRKIHDRSLPLISPDSNVLDVACGTGALVFKLRTKAKKVTGIDLNEEMINTAIKTQEKQNITNVDFQVMDATDLSIFKDNEFDQATISMAIHQFDPETARRVLLELKRVSKEIMIGL